MLTQQEADVIIEQSQFKNIWCFSKVCGCLGCVNNHSNIEAKGVTYAQWLDWIERNPEKASEFSYTQEEKEQMEQMFNTFRKQVNITTLIGDAK